MNLPAALRPSSSDAAKTTLKAMPTVVEYPADLSAPSQARWAMWGIIIALVILVIWASVAQVNQVTRAPAQVIVSSRTQLVQSVDGGTVTQIHVREGDKVTTGQLLVTLEKARASAAVSDSQAKVAALRITLARLEAEVYGKPLKFEPDLQSYPEYIRNQTHLYNNRQKALNDDLTSLGGILKLANEELRINQALEQSGDVSRAEVLRLQRTVADVTAQIVNKRNKYFQDVQAEMTKAQEDFATQTEQLRDRSQVLEQTELRALGDGLVNQIKINSIGGVVRPGDVLMELLPQDDNILVEAKVSTADIAFVEVGQTASVKLDAYDASIFGGLVGKVIYISPDVLTEETQQGPRPYFRVHIRITGTEFSKPIAQQIQLRPGLTASTDIKAMNRSVLSYLTKPITKTFGQSLGER